MENPVIARSAALAEVSKLFACEHKEYELRLRTVARGGRQRVMQCMRCGAATSNPYSKQDAYALTGGHEPPPFNDELLSGWERRKKAAYGQVEERFAFLAVRVDPERPKSSEWFKQYDKYLESPQWSTTRDKVLKRAQGVCEGCLERPAIHIHHQTYAHLGHEFMFELLALCEECHARLHGA